MGPGAHHRRRPRAAARPGLQHLGFPAPPAVRTYGTFTFASAGDGRTFLAGADPWAPSSPAGGYASPSVSFYLLRFDPAGRAAAVEDITLGVKDGYQCYYPVLMTSDGSKLVCGVAADYYYREAGGSEPGRGGFAVYDIRTGDLTDVLGAEGPGQPGAGPWRQTPAVAWASPRGTILIGQPMLGKVSIFSNARYQPIAWTGVQLANLASQPASDGLPGNH